MPLSLKQSLKNTLLSRGFAPERLKRFDFRRQFSHFDEEILLQKYLRALAPAAKTDFIVDIAAGDGVTMSNTYALFRAGTPGLAVELDDRRFRALSRHYRSLPQVRLLHQKVTPENVLSILGEARVPRDFSLLNLDIDGYDYFVLAKILCDYRPALICTEINEAIPPPLKFTVRYDPEFAWATDRFFGMSIAQLHGLAQQTGYDLVELHYNNAFLIRSEINPFPALSAEQAYDAGYRLKPDRKQKFPGTVYFEPVLQMDPPAAKVFIEEAFYGYVDAYDLSL